MPLLTELGRICLVISANMPALTGLPAGARPNADILVTRVRTLDKNVAAAKRRYQVLNLQTVGEGMNQAFGIKGSPR